MRSKWLIALLTGLFILALAGSATLGLDGARVRTGRCSVNATANSIQAAWDFGGRKGHLTAPCYGLGICFEVYDCVPLSGYAVVDHGQSSWKYDQPGQPPVPGTCPCWFDRSTPDDAVNLGSWDDSETVLWTALAWIGVAFAGAISRTCDSIA